MTAQTMRRVRQFHLYLGVFFAPMIVLFALSGALQTFRLQEEKGWGSQPPAVIEWMASVHMNSRLPKAKPPAAGAKPPEAGAKAVETGAQGGEMAAVGVKAEKKAPAVKKPSKLPMQIFVTLLSVGLMLSAFLGVAIALNNRATRVVSVAMLVAGSLVPILLLKL